MTHFSHNLYRFASIPEAPKSTAVMRLWPFLRDLPDRLPEVNPPTATGRGVPTFGQEPEVFGFTFTVGIVTKWVAQ